MTIGVKRGIKQPPRLGDHVDIGAGAKILGPINIYNNVLIGANSVVVKDVAAELVVAGVPAKIISKVSLE